MTLSLVAIYSHGDLCLSHNDAIRWATKRSLGIALAVTERQETVHELKASADLDRFVTSLSVSYNTSEGRYFVQGSADDFVYFPGASGSITEKVVQLQANLQFTGHYGSAIETWIRLEIEHFALDPVPRPWQVPVPTPVNGPTVYGGFYVEQQLLRGAPKFYNMRDQIVADYHVDISAANLSVAIQAALQETSMAYWRLVHATHLEQIAHKKVEDAFLDLKATQEEVASGWATPLDLYQAEIALVESQLVESEVHASTRDASDALAVCLDLPLSINIVPDTIMNTDELIRQLSELIVEPTDIQRSPHIFAARREEDLALHELRVARHQGLPSVTIGYGATKYRYWYEDTKSSPVFPGGVFHFAMLNVQVPLGHRTILGQVDAARAGLAARQADVEATYIEIYSQYTALIRRAEETLATLNLHERQVALAEECVSATRDSIASGRATLIELFEAKQSLFQVQEELATTQLEGYVTLAELRFVRGHEY
ncbi:MAG: TolC family protein [Alphaproteobacteria bacterium]|nr:TolC family protein [Alphaproteobacteria bacterium]